MTRDWRFFAPLGYHPSRQGEKRIHGFLESFLMSNAPAPAELRTEFCEILFPYPWLRLSHLEHLD